ncbi:fibronectin type III domain-containing protein [Paraconexibacter algicola]|uniref:Fibronectin type-III domain-containing protein n=1 Tax=Paraconexibacter algicola TaxID=2133960 RepID=A0A2T4UH50_9ACTN|nr:fibronectin type III domain-containing protein [Paraconexibacter algicola]PTL58574.1 hypothetical protein C7Y72_02315 [Paraconexibacter algicola]
MFSNQLRAPRVAVVIAAGMLPLLATPAADAAPRTGSLKLEIRTPSGVPATATLRAGARRVVAAKADRGTVLRRTLKLRAATYTVDAAVLQHDGRLYGPAASPARVRIRARRSAKLTLRYVLLPTASALTPSEISPTTLSFSWSGPAGASYVVRRAPGFDAPATPSAGTAVAVVGSAASDTGLTPGSQYSYSVFTVTGGRTLGPATLTVGTAPAPGNAVPAFVAATGTEILESRDLTAARELSDGVGVQLAAGEAAPTIGSHLVVPAKGAIDLPFVGRVAGVAQDGTVKLVPASLPEAYDYVNIDIPGFAQAAVPAKPASRASARAKKMSSCKLAAGSDLGIESKLGLDGRFRYEFAKRKIRFTNVEVPVGVTLDVRGVVTSETRAYAEVKASLACSAELASIKTQISPPPVPLAMTFTPKVQLDASGSLRYSGGGVKTATGFEVSGRFPGDARARPVLEREYLAPEGAELSGSLRARLGGELLIGPGGAAPGASLVAGVKGSLFPLDATVSPVYPVGDPRAANCVKVEAKGSGALGLSAEATLGPFSASADLTLLDGSFEYFERPFPQDCDKKPAPATPADPGTSVPPPTGGGGSQLPDCDCGPPPGFRRTSVI